MDSNHRGLHEPPGLQPGTFGLSVSHPDRGGRCRIRTCAPREGLSFSKRALSTAQPISRVFANSNTNIEWWTTLDSNQRPPGYQPDALHAELVVLISTARPGSCRGLRTDARLTEPRHSTTRDALARVMTGTSCAGRLLHGELHRAVLDVKPWTWSCGQGSNLRLSAYEAGALSAKLPHDTLNGSARQVSILRPPALQTGALPTELRTDVVCLARLSNWRPLQDSNLRPSA